eukprot:CAMPEP_0114985270 /NCGR_PEP_ID=MMETSP0216-20121206/7757_1 /TAXON_ID=223996 /ORGANISM="Protocruzia adherens, Strain Boccale" /LENGTH=377 /DNA_ID=CAMNT_0002347535 /DNA_START=77 /DNA_END=1207 /DNA_ORIENTATION=+
MEASFPRSLLMEVLSYVHPSELFTSVLKTCRRFQDVILNPQFMGRSFGRIVQGLSPSDIERLFKAEDDYLKACLMNGDSRPLQLTVDCTDGDVYRENPWYWIENMLIDEKTSYCSGSRTRDIHCLAVAGVCPINKLLQEIGTRWIKFMSTSELNSDPISLDHWRRLFEQIGIANLCTKEGLGAFLGDVQAHGLNYLALMTQTKTPDWYSSGYYSEQPEESLSGEPVIEEILPLLEELKVLLEGSLVQFWEQTAGIEDQTILKTVEGYCSNDDVLAVIKNIRFERAWGYTRPARTFMIYTLASRLEREHGHKVFREPMVQMFDSCDSLNKLDTLLSRDEIQEGYTTIIEESQDGISCQFAMKMGTNLPEGNSVNPLIW